MTQWPLFPKDPVVSLTPFYRTPLTAAPKGGIDKLLLPQPQWAYFRGVVSIAAVALNRQHYPGALYV